jgi:hypothetical protein
MASRACNLWGLFLHGYVLSSQDEGELVPKMVWRVKLAAELEPGLTNGGGGCASRAREQAELGPRLAEAKQLTAALQAEMVAQRDTKRADRMRQSLENHKRKLAGHSPDAIRPSACRVA